MQGPCDKWMWVSSTKVIQTDHCMQNWIKAFKDTSATLEGIAQVAGTDSVCVPANSIRFVHVRGPHRKHWKFPSTPICIEPSSQIDSLLIINTVVEQGSGAYAVPVAYLTSTDIWIPPRTRLGLMSECMLEPSSVSKVEFVQTNVCEQTVVPHNDIAADGGTSLDLTALLPTDLRCTETQKKKIEDVFKRYSDIFIQHDLDMGYTSTVTHKIDTVDDKPVCQPYRRIPPSQSQEVKEHIQSLLDKNIITKSTSPYTSPIVVVRKKDGSIRLCVDYRKLNQKTIRDAFPLPRIEESLDALHGSSLFSTWTLLAAFTRLLCHLQTSTKLHL
ncbi:uncharacterized protein LOC128156537 [Crassostrea angulata]|uniref:uncharacterized protein LOC128156537 n=1 Tax=Magallana angulata TaxID=2784310 RepID=UPI0022B0CDB7|nr:uncharacterized protein LOC128156537 [Crassostrea angulata]